nr:hypothetical protein [Providencia huaxiensis]
MTDQKGESIGIVGQGGMVFISSEIATNAIITWDKGQCTFSLAAGNSKEVLCQ